jgi:hypothetical protein
MLYKSFVVMGVALLGLYSYAQYQGWSVWGVDESRSGTSSSGAHGSSSLGRSVYHK